MKDAAGSTVFPHGTFYRATGSLSAVTGETSLIVLNADQFKEAVLLTRLEAITGGGAFTVKVYQLDAANIRYGPLVTRAPTTASANRDVVTAPFGNKLEITFELSGTTPTATAQIELQMKT